MVVSSRLVACDGEPELERVDVDVSGLSTEAFKSEIHTLHSYTCITHRLAKLHHRKLTCMIFVSQFFTVFYPPPPPKRSYI